MSKTIATENAPAAIGPYVQGVDLGLSLIHIYSSTACPRFMTTRRRLVRKWRKSLAYMAEWK